MRRVILTFLLTSLLWWAVFTYMAYNRDKLSSPDEIESVEEQSVSEYEESQSSDAVPEKKEEVAEKKVAEKPNPTPSAKNTSVKKPASAPKQEPVVEKNNAQKPATSTPQQMGNISQEIVGKWQPVEGAEYSMEFTKYGTAIQYRGSYQSRHPYSLNGNIAKIGYSNNLKIEITSNGGVTYLEIYDSDDYSGKYKRVSRPKVINYNAISGDLYTTAIVGKWTPIDGQEYAMEFTKYGVAIQVRGSYNSRTEYKLEGNKLKIAYDNNAKVALWEDANNYYLEIFNTTDFSGRYKKAK